MFYWLIELSNTVPGFGIFRGLFNVFRYSTFRTGGAMVTGALFVFLFGLLMIGYPVAFTIGALALFDLIHRFAPVLTS